MTLLYDTLGSKMMVVMLKVLAFIKILMIMISRDRVNVPRDMTIWAARRLREALEVTAALAGNWGREICQGLRI